MSDLDTEIEGSVATIRGVATWLTRDLRPGLGDLSDAVAAQRSAAQGDWDGEAGSAFAQRAGTLTTSADDGAQITGEVADDVETLATALGTAQQAMADVRVAACVGELVVDGFWVRNPDAAVQEHPDRVRVWNRCVEDATAAWEAWQAALDTAGSAWADHDSQYVGIAAQLLSAGVQVELIRRTTPILTAEVDSMLTRAAELRAHADALRTPDGQISDPSRFYDLLDQADRLDDAHPAARGNLPSWELPRGLTRGLWVLDVAAAGYSIHSDWDEEGPAQAITSNAVPAAASIASGVAAGAATGAIVGTFIPVPGVGTAAGVVVGAGVGLVVGAFTSGAVDSLFESGADSLGDWGGAVADGADEIADTVSGLAEGAGEVFDSIF
ncbi:hypothetical protein NPS01_29270 [Nocardioides psychrotolerans]|uniref:Uncharacterized protein n=1 Tax=Nocardioides psychrotolerans TaxID=1005945 RepID=A0A1I3DWN9_9ACTN|nr:hypothetical protein [Nocardioides psychrotolerans]GEP39264.1 hypothetical protein NPS01_29270 [Nocardioides psychrotolerans]SFH90871.1 hypothetical protein SAMN05216561_103108 [Nocardioides psychrotolerans]